jgi:hypothetical protein
LFAALPSGVELLTVAEFVYVPLGAFALVVTLIVIVQSDPGARLVRLHDTAFPTLEQVPPDEELTELTVNWDGTVSETDRSVAADGPALWTVRV